jgi:hypothetical protein
MKALAGIAENIDAIIIAVKANRTYADVSFRKFSFSFFTLQTERAGYSGQQ